MISKSLSRDALHEAFFLGQLVFSCLPLGILLLSLIFNDLPFDFDKFFLDFLVPFLLLFQENGKFNVTVSFVYTVRIAYGG